MQQQNQKLDWINIGRFSSVTVAAEYAKQRFEFYTGKIRRKGKHFEIEFDFSREAA